MPHHAERSLRSSSATTAIEQYTRTEQAGRSAASGRSAFDLVALPGGREEVLWSGSTGMDAGRAAMGHGWPVAACPRSRTGAREPERSEGRTMGRGPFGSFWVLPKGTRCKSETNIPVRHKCRICTRWICYLQLNNAPVANQARAASVRCQRIQRLVDIPLGQLHQVHDRQHQIARRPAQAIPRLIRAGTRTAQQV